MTPQEDQDIAQGMPGASRYGGPVQNTDRELWREREGDYYADSIHVTKGGGIGMNVGGTVYVMPIREWHRLAGAPGRAAPAELDAAMCPLCGTDCTAPPGGQP